MRTLEEHDDQGQRTFYLIISENSSGTPWTKIDSDGEIDLAKVCLLVEGWLERMKIKYKDSFFES